jgi:hypothetical protein
MLLKQKEDRKCQLYGEGGPHFGEDMVCGLCQSIRWPIKQCCSHWSGSLEQAKMHLQVDAHIDDYVGYLGHLVSIFCAILSREADALTLMLPFDVRSIG